GKKRDTSGFADSRPRYSFDYTALSQQGFLIPNSERSTIAEEYRSLKRPILMNAFGKGAVPVENGNLIMVTSSVPGEGKTFSSLNLAMSMAMERDKTVLLVDCDVLRASMTKLLGLKDRIGLLEVLKSSSVSLNDVIIKTDIPNFSIIPAGQPQLNSTELLASEEMERITFDLSARYPDRIILFDAPPLLATTEASVITELMGQIIMVVECGGTLHGTVTEALAQLNKDKIIGLLLNKSRRTARSEYYSGGGYYGK
ncbi:MAG: XrtA-associated tyrosine autokinase, partial [Thiohalomonadales bacterium]